MANIIIKMELDDIKTCKLGNNIMIETKNNIDIIFTSEAIEELINDYNSIKEIQ